MPAAEDRLMLLLLLLSESEWRALLARSSLALLLMLLTLLLLSSESAPSVDPCRRAPAPDPAPAPAPAPRSGPPNLVLRRMALPCLPIAWLWLWLWLWWGEWSCLLTPLGSWTRFREAAGHAMHAQSAERGREGVTCGWCE